MIIDLITKYRSSKKPNNLITITLKDKLGRYLEPPGLTLVCHVDGLGTTSNVPT